MSNETEWNEWWSRHLEPSGEDDNEFHLWSRYGDELIDPGFFGDEYQEVSIDRVRTFIVDTQGRVPVSIEPLEQDIALDESESIEIDSDEMEDSRSLDMLRPAAETEALRRVRASLAGMSDAGLDWNIDYLCMLAKAGVKILELRNTLEAELRDRANPISFKRNDLMDLSAVSNQQIEREIEELDGFIADKLGLNDILWCLWLERAERRRRRSTFRWQGEGF